MSTPSKRRRTSPTTYVTVGDQENSEQAQPRPTTPKRASYQSPTKASLARSNPRVLQQVAQAKDRRESEPNRRQSLRDVVLAGQRSVPEGHQGDEEQITPPAVTAQDPSRPSAHTVNLATEITNTFRDQPSAESVRSENAKPVAPQRALSYTPRRNDVALPSFTSPSIVPRLVQSTSATRQDNRRSTSADLPPIAIQLGSGARPDRPRGLASSSPGGGSRRRVRERSGHVTSSPLKPKAQAPPVTEFGDELDHVEAASGISDDPEGLEGQNVECGIQINEATDDPPNQEKQQQLSSLHEELKAIQEQYNKIKEISNTLTQTKSGAHTQSKLDDDLAFILDCTPPLHQNSSSSHLVDHPLFKKHTTSYLTLFTPANLHITYQTWEEGITTEGRGGNNFVYQTTFAAPAPWPPNVLNLTFDVITSQLMGQITEIIFARKRQEPIALQRWIDGRLASPMFRTDLATIVTGVGRYFEEDVKRARVYRRLSERIASDGAVEQADTPSLVRSPQDALGLLPYLNMTQYIFNSASASAQSEKRTRRSTGSAKQVMLTYDISLDWIGQASTEVDICASGFSSDVLTGARKLFREVEGVDGVEAAFEAVWGVLGMDAAGNGAGKPGAVTKKGKKKARRMTVFDSPTKI